MKVEGDSIHLSGFYKENNRWIIRVYNASTNASTGRIIYDLQSKQRYFWEENAMGKALSDQEIYHGNIELQLGPHQIKIFIIEKNRGVIIW